MMRSNKPILVLGPENGDVKGIVEAKKKGTSFEYDNETAIRSFVQKAVLENEIEGYDESVSIIEFSNFELSKKVAGYLDEIT